MVCLLVSLKKEIDYFLDLLKDVKKRKASGHAIYRGQINGNEVEVIKTGIGNKPFGRKLLESCSAVVSTGFCGALSGNLKTGDLVLSTELVSADEKLLNGLYRATGTENRIDGLSEQKPKKIPMAVAVGEKLRLMQDKDIKIHQGRTVTASRTIRNYNEKFKLGQATGAVSVDMEDYHRMELADIIGVPFLSVRSVLDELDNDVPGFGSGFHFRSNVTSLLKNLKPAAVSLACALKQVFSLKLLK
jgi:adenosylhomocysteine nucleosidase